MSHPILSWLEARQDEMLALLGELVELESPSTDKSAVDRLGRRLASKLVASGARVKLVEVEQFGNHLVAEVEGADADGAVLVLGHMDTVWETGALQEMPFHVEEGRAYGPGVFDMKAGLVQALYAIRALKETDRQPATRAIFIINSDEEIGSSSSRDLVEGEASRSRAVFVLEPALGSEGRLKTFRKGVGVFQIHVRGQAAHAGLDPGHGVSAIEELARQIQALHKMTSTAGGITVNVGTVQGGTRSNVIAAEAQAEIDLRISTLADAEKMQSRILGIQPYLDGAEVVVTGGVDRPPLERSSGVVALFEKAQNLARELGFELGEGSAGGGSDGNFTAALGVPTLDGLGAVGDGAHAAHEHTVIAEMPRRAALLARLLETV
jgi:glutamate carboxypeptidase